MGRKLQMIGGALFIVLATAVFASATTYSTFVVTKTVDANDGVCCGEMNGPVSQTQNDQELTGASPNQVFAFSKYKEIK